MTRTEAQQQAWQPLPLQDPSALDHARHALHQAIQWPAAFGRSYQAADPGDQTASLVWDDALGGFRSDYVGGMYKYALALNVADFALHFVSWSQEVNERLALEGQTAEDVDAWVQQQLEQGHFNVGKYSRQHPYELPPGIAAPEGQLAKPAQAALVAHTVAYQNAWHTLTAFVQARPGTHPLRMWPHHFDIGSYQVLQPHDDPEQQKVLGWGYATGDADGLGPYFYAYPWPYPQPDALTRHQLTEGRWQTEGWTGARLFYSALAPMQDAAEQNAAAHRFLAEATQALQQEVEALDAGTYVPYPRATN